VADNDSAARDPREDDRRWASLAARCALCGLAVWRSDHRDGPAKFFSLCGDGRAMLHPDLAGVRARLNEITGGQ
jgi:hypothetical protein